LTKCINIVFNAEKKLKEDNEDIATAILGKLNHVLLKKKWQETINIH
jgi:hypothetical protein